MKILKNLLPFLLCTLMLATANFGLQNLYAKTDRRERHVNQVEFASSALSDVQESVDESSLLDAKNGYGGSTYELANMINYDLSTKVISCENFDMNSYPNRGSVENSANLVSSNLNAVIDCNSNDVEMSESWVPDDIEYAVSPNSIIGSDERIQVSKPKDWPYRGVARIKAKYRNVLKQSDGKYYDITCIGTGFMEGKNLMVTAGHCAYGDITSSGEYDDGVFNPRFPDEIEIYAGLNGSSEESPSYEYYAKASVINIQKEYFETASSDYDWCAIQLDRDLGYLTGSYGKISNWYENGASVYSYGYPGDKPGTMWETHGRLTWNSAYKYAYDFDTVSGQSGSPVFMTGDDGNVYVCGIHTSGGEYSNYATRINSFIFHYLNSFVVSHNYERLAATIVPTDYGFADAYPTDDYTKNNYTTHTLSSGFKFRTKRYRTGYIHNEYVVMSPFRSGITEAFIEYNFDVPISKIEVFLSHWRSLSHEWTYSTNCSAVLRIKDGSNYITILDLLSDTTKLSTDRNNQTKYTIEFPKTVYSFEFYMKSSKVNVNDNNRGRICIGGMNVYAKEEWH